MVLLYSPSGEILRRISFPGEPGRYSLLTQGLNRLLVQEPTGKGSISYYPKQRPSLDLGTADCQLFDSVTRIVISTAVNPSRSNPPGTH